MNYFKGEKEFFPGIGKITQVVFQSFTHYDLVFIIIMKSHRIF